MLHVFFVKRGVGSRASAEPRRTAAVVRIQGSQSRISLARRSWRRTARDALALCVLVVGAALSGCSSERPTAPVTAARPDSQPVGTTPVGTKHVDVNSMELGNGPLTVMSAFGTAPVNNGAATLIMPSGSMQLVFVLDAAGQVRGLTLSSADSNGAHMPAADAAMTGAVVLLFTPGAMTRDTLPLAKRLEAIRASPCLPRLTGALRTALQIMPLQDALVKDSVRAALDACEGTTLATSSRTAANARRVRALVGTDVSTFGFDARSVLTEPAPYVTLSNRNRISSDVYRRDLFASGAKSPTAIGKLPSAGAVSLGSLFTGSTFPAGTLDDFDTPMRSAAPTFEYWFTGGVLNPKDPLPAGIPNNRWLFFRDLYSGVLSPIIDSFCHTCVLGGRADQYWNAAVSAAELANGAQFPLDLSTATSPAEASRVLIDEAAGIAQDMMGLLCVSADVSRATCAMWTTMFVGKLLLSIVNIGEFAWDAATTPSLVRLQIPNLVGPRLLAVKSGDGQHGTAGETLAAKLAVVAMSEAGGERSEVPISFVVTSGGGSVETSSTQTDASGVAMTTWKLGTSVGSQKLNARLTAADEIAVVFQATAVAPAKSYTVRLSSLPSDGGSTTGSGTFVEDPNTPPVATVTATPAANFRFKNWTENGTVVSTETVYRFSVTADRDLVANFAPVAVAGAKLTIASLTPVDGIALAAGQSRTWEIVVQSAGAPVTGATVSGADCVTGQAYQTVPTVRNGVTRYTTTVPSGRATGFCDLPFTASKAGYTSSETLTRFVQVVSQPTLRLFILPTGTQSLAVGASQIFTMRLLDAMDAGVSDATISGKDEVIGGMYTPFVTDQNGTATYSTTVPAGRRADNYTLTFTARKNGYSASAEEVRLVSVVAATAPLRFTQSETLSGGTVGTSYSSDLGVTGGQPPYDCTLSSGTIPAGLHLSACTITGSPTAAGLATFAVQAKDAGGQTATKTFSLTVAAATTPLRFTASATLPGGTVGSNYSTDFGVSGGRPPYRCAVSSGSVPGDLSLSGCALIGRPMSAGTFKFSITANDADARTEVQDFTLIVDAAVSAASVTTLAATNVTETSFQGNLTLDVKGKAGQWAIEYGTTAALTNVQSTNGFDAAASSGAQSVSAVINSLTCGTVWYYRGVVVQNGIASRGSIVPVTTASCPPRITSVSPSSPTGSSQKQPFTITGTGFDANATVDLMDVTNGQAHDNRTVSSRTGTTIVINPVFGLQKNDWWVRVTNSDGKVSNQFPFKIR